MNSGHFTTAAEVFKGFKKKHTELVPNSEWIYLHID